MMNSLAAFGRWYGGAARHRFLMSGISFLIAVFAADGAVEGAKWPQAGAVAKPHAYWWWMGSAVDTTNIAKELSRYDDAGLGGVHIIPIYGAKGWEASYIDYLSPEWMALLNFTVTNADQLGLDVDMTTGTGWCFGGPEVTDDEANALMVHREWTLSAGEKLKQNFEDSKPQALMAFGSGGQKVDLLGAVQSDGSVNWTTPQGQWTVYAISQRPGPQKVKRAAPGGEGWMLNLAYPKAMADYLKWIDAAFTNYEGAKPRAQYHDSYEYKMDWSPVLFAEFERRRGYRLQDELDAFLKSEPEDRAARLKCDYRETISDIMAEETLPMWVNWAHERGFITRNEAHGSPGNLLDLYAVADIPESEMFSRDRNKLVSKLASSAAHVTGKKLVGNETGTWLKEHFTVTLADLKYLVDDLFVSGINHIFYHGTCYSPDEAEWPGWVFYASTEMNPRNSIWHDVPALNAYITRCQSILQSGEPDNDILLYWPIHDSWSNAEGMTENLTVHARGWLEEQPFGKAAERLWNRGYGFDYVSDRQLMLAGYDRSVIRLPGGTYRAIVVPRCERMPLDTLEKLAWLARSGATVIFEDQLPKDVPGLGRLDERRARFASVLSELKFMAGQRTAGRNSPRIQVLVGDIESTLAASGIRRESLVDRQGLWFIRRKFDGGNHYFIANRGSGTVLGWVPLSSAAKSVVLMDPMNGSTGLGAVRPDERGGSEVYLQLLPGESIIVRVFGKREQQLPAWPYRRVAGQSVTVEGNWQVEFTQGGPHLPRPFETTRLASWTELGGTEAERFAGTAVYRIKFDSPDLSVGQWRLDLGEVAESARIRLNGRDLGTDFTPPYRADDCFLRSKDNLLEVEVTNLSANRIRDLDRRGVNWRYFNDINFVNINYRPFDASEWPLAESGLLGPVMLTPMTLLRANDVP